MLRWIVLTVALVLGFVLLGYDRRTDDTGVEVALILAVSLGLTLAAPPAALGVALAVGLPMAVLNGSWPGILVAGAGALVGYAMARGVSRG